MLLYSPMIWLLWKLTPAARWHARRPQHTWRYRFGFWVVSREWFRGDQAIGWRTLPHFMAADRRVIRGQSIIWPGKQA